jgi:hypothetical protein
MEDLVIGKYEAKEIDNAFRLVINTFDCSSKETCLDRCVMEAKFYIESVLDGKPNQSYYLQNKKTK